jgi:hypothetical protein
MLVREVVGKRTHVPETKDQTRCKVDPPVINLFNDRLDQAEELDGVVTRLAVDLNQYGLRSQRTLSLTWQFSGCMSMSMTSVNSGIG